MPRTLARSARASRALGLVETLQSSFVRRLEAIEGGRVPAFVPVEWLRDDGRHGGGVRYEAGDSQVFDRASVNVSQVQYDDDPERRLAAATALSTIVHPRNPRAPSVHMHVSWTEMKQGAGYWRVMADLNPAIEEPGDRETFEQALRVAAGPHDSLARACGDRYFEIAALGRHRGVVHYYLEGFDTGDFEGDAATARGMIEAGIDAYARILTDAIERPPLDDGRSRQLAYHTVYLFQVLTLDRGTTSGLLVHDQNDVGTLGSLPSHVDRDLLASWEPRMTSPQDELLRALVAALPDASPSPVTTEAKRALAAAVRSHYRAHPEALELQASGGVDPPTVRNHCD